MADVFISYATEDRDRVKPVVKAIERAGFSVWWDRRISLGSSFDREIERELDSAKCVVVVWSTHSVDSDWVRNEAQEGLDRGILVPLLIDDVKPPLAFRRAQTAVLSNGPTQEEFELVISTLQSITGQPENRTPNQPEALASQDTESFSTSWKWKWLTAGTVTVILVIVFFSWWWTGYRDIKESLPFDRSIAISVSSRSNSSDITALSAGLAGELSNTIATYQELRLVAAAPDAILSESSYVLNVDLQAAETIFKLRAQLIRTSNNQPFWSTDLNLESNFNLNELAVVSRKIGRIARLQLVTDYECVLYRLKTSSREAADYLCFSIKENNKINQGVTTDFELGLVNSRRAVELDPNFADAYHALANDYMVGAILGNFKREEASRLAHAAIDRALGLEANNPAYHYLRGALFLYLDLDYAAAEESLTQAITIDPLHPWAQVMHGGLGLIALRRGAIEPAIKNYQRAVTINDADTRMWREYAGALLAAGLYKESIRAAQNAS